MATAMERSILKPLGTPGSPFRETRLSPSKVGSPRPDVVINDTLKAGAMLMCLPRPKTQPGEISPARPGRSGCGGSRSSSTSRQSWRLTGPGKSIDCITRKFTPLAMADVCASPRIVRTFRPCQPSRPRTSPRTADELRKMDAYWRAANYLSVGQIYLMDNPLLKEPLELEARQAAAAGALGDDAGPELHLRPPQPGHQEHDLNVIYIAGPGHGGPGMVANTYLEGTYSEIYPNIVATRRGCGGCSSSSPSPAASPATPPPRRPARSTRAASSGTPCRTPSARRSTTPTCSSARVVGDGEAETGPLATSWHSNKFLNPVRDGAVLPILHLNGYKIAGPTVLARITRDELTDLLSGYGYTPTSWRATTRSRCTGSWPPTLDESSWRSGGSRPRPARRVHPSTARAGR